MHCPWCAGEAEGGMCPLKGMALGCAYRASVMVFACRRRSSGGRDVCLGSWVGSGSMGC